MLFSAFQQRSSRHFENDQSFYGLFSVESDEKFRNTFGPSLLADLLGKSPVMPLYQPQNLRCAGASSWAKNAHKKSINFGKFNLAPRDNYLKFWIMHKLHACTLWCSVGAICFQHFVSLLPRK